MKIRTFISYFFLLVFIPGVFASSKVNAQSWKIFDDTAVGEVKIIIQPEYLEYILDPDNAESDSLFPATFIYKNAVISGDTLYEIGFRLRGNTSRKSAKKSFKVDINHFVPGRQFYGLEKINLNGEHNDPSIIRSKLCWDLFNEIDVPASRANHVMVYINDEYRGLYINVEHIDDEFVQKRFGTQNGNLYKCLYPADLVYLGSDQELYKQYYWGRQAYDLKTNKQEDDYTDFAHFVDVLNNTPQTRFKTEIEKVFNVDNFLKWLAMNVLMGSWDDYWYLKNNYYLYHNPETDKFEFIPYDYDNTYGIDWVGGDWGTRYIYNWGHPEEHRPLVTRVLSVPQYRNAYTQYLSDFMENEFAFDNQQPKIDRIKAMITPAAEADNYRSLDWDFSIADFHRSFTDSVSTIRHHVPYGIKPYIKTRIASAKAQLTFINLPPTIAEVMHSPHFPEPDQAVTITAKIEDDSQINQVKLFGRTANSTWTFVKMFDDGNHKDGSPNDQVFGAEFTPQPEGSIIYYYVEVNDNHGAVSRSPQTAPNNAYFYLSQNSSESDILVNLHFNKSLQPSDMGVGLLGSFNDWNKIYPMKQTDSDMWEISFFLSPGSYIYKFVTYQNLEGNSGVTEWIADPENPERDGPPYYNAVLNVCNPMIYYIKPLNKDTVHTLTPVISAQFSCSRNTTINVQSIELKIDDHSIDHPEDYYDPNRQKVIYHPDSSLVPGKHTIFVSVQNSAGDYSEATRQFFVDVPLLFINEFMARNDNIIADEFNEYDDWIELYNGDKRSIDLAGMYLTDNLSRPKRWMLPGMSLDAGEFLLLWADGEPDEGPLHINFKLSGSGEQIGLFASIGDGNYPIDTLSFDEQQPNVSYGRFPDGEFLWQLFTSPTPGQPNSAATEIHLLKHKSISHFELWQNYPNPFNPMTTIKFVLPSPQEVSLKIFNICGQLIKILLDKEHTEGYHSITWDGRDKFGKKAASGIYFYQLKAEDLLIMRKMILLR